MNHVSFEKTLRQSRAFEMIKKDISQNLSHAYLLVSPDEDVAQSFLMLVSCAIYCAEKNACMDCPECVKNIHFNHPNVRWINLQREQIKADDIKELTQSTYIKAYDDSAKVYFVLAADKMTPQSQNKLLKTLEEPPENVTIFLAAANEFAFLDTVRSRCRLVRIESFSYEAVFSEIMDLTHDKNVSQVAAACSEGLLGKALKIAQNKSYLRVYEQALDVLKNLKRSSDTARYTARENLPDNANEYLDALSILLRDILAAKHDKEQILSKHLEAQILDLSQDFSEKAIVSTLNDITLARQKLFFNINSAAVLESLYFSMLEAKHKWR